MTSSGLRTGATATAELERLAEGWRPFRTWVMVTARAWGGRLEG